MFYKTKESNEIGLATYAAKALEREVDNFMVIVL